MRWFALATLLAVSLSPVAVAQHAVHGSPSTYAGQDLREIKSLSSDDIAELRRGGGWGLAKAAELNGVPGPAHLLELKEQLGLTADQVSAIHAIHEKMRNEAIGEGERLIALERGLEQQFKSRKVSDASLRTALDAIEQSRSRLRYIHLLAHLTTPPLLTPGQLEKYIALRGYGSNPCAAVPPEHDAAMWRKHNGCR